MQHLNFKKYINKSTIIATIIGILLTYFFTKILDPVCEMFYSIILDIGDSIFTSFSNSTYRAIADGLSEQGSYTILYIMFILVSMYAGNLLGQSDAIYRANCKEYERLETKIKFLSTPCDSEIQKSPTPTFEEQLEGQKNTINKLKKSNVLFHKLSKIGIIILIVLFAFLYSRQNFIHAKSVAALNSIEIVSPFISDSEYKHFKSRFYLIQNKQDYESLIDEIHSIMIDNNINQAEH